MDRPRSRDGKIWLRTFESSWMGKRVLGRDGNHVGGSRVVKSGVVKSAIRTRA